VIGTIRRLGARRCLAALGSGLLLALSLPKFGHAAVAWLALVPLLVAMQRRDGRGAGWLAYLAGGAASIGLLYWTGLVVVQFGGLSPALGAGAMVLLAAVVGLFYALFGAVVGLWLRAFGGQAILLAPVAWVAVELVRARGPLAFPWCLLGYSQHAWLPIVQVAALTGVYGVSFLVVAVSSAIAYALVVRGRRGVVAVGGAAALVAGALVFGWWRLATPPAVETMRVGLVQAAIPQDEKWSVDLAWRNIGWQVALTREAAEEGATLVVWPESAVPFYYDWTPEVAQELSGLVRETGTYLLFGNDDREGLASDARVWVGAKLLDPRGRVVLRYHKIRLVPFGEYVPMQPLLGALGVEKLVQEVGAFTPGTEARLGRVGQRSVGVTICYEAIFPDLARRFVAGGADLLANVTNDGWYGTTSAPYQHFAMARLRAVENGRSLVRAANTGISALIDPRGRVIAASRLMERRIVVGDVPLATEITPYARWGDVLAWLCLAASVALCAAGWVVVRRRRRADAKAG